MDNCINERLKLLAAAQESMIEISNIMEHWENSQMILEKSTFDSMNISDKALNLSRDGKMLIVKMKDTCRMISKNSDKSDAEAMSLLLDEAGSLFQRILEAARIANDIAHNLEQEVASQRDIAEQVKDSVYIIKKNVDQTAACAEFLLAEL